MASIKEGAGGRMREAEVLGLGDAVAIQQVLFGQSLRGPLADVEAEHDLSQLNIREPVFEGEPTET